MLKIFIIFIWININVRQVNKMCLIQVYVFIYFSVTLGKVIYKNIRLQLWVKPNDLLQLLAAIIY